jgi:hypothetical protein
VAGPRGLSTGTIGVRGYRVVSFFPTGSKPKAVYVHRLVCEAFNGPPPFEGALVRHLDGDRLNNLAENLAWGTHADNTADAKRHGTLKNYGKLTVDQVREIKAALAAGGETYEEIGRRYGVTGSCVYTIKKGKAWAWVQ